MNRTTYLEILKYLTSEQLDHLYNRNLNHELNITILHLKKDRIIKLLNTTQDEINRITTNYTKVIDKIENFNSKKNEVIFETKDSLEASHYMIYGCRVEYDEIRNIYLIREKL
jgi:tRNA/tmRNA/rRNA uracil-C5-methylase (TrmA/RlmC/RlmD family)